MLKPTVKGTVNYQMTVALKREGGERESAVLPALFLFQICILLGEILWECHQNQQFSSRQENQF